jgi:hypothetical protein
VDLKRLFDPALKDVGEGEKHSQVRGGDRFLDNEKASA